jgi:hypothetical protein
MVKTHNVVSNALKNKASNKANKQQRDRELQAVLNKPLPKITSITNNIVSFDHSPIIFSYF